MARVSRFLRLQITVTVRPNLNLIVIASKRQEDPGCRSYAYVYFRVKGC